MSGPAAPAGGALAASAAHVTAQQTEWTVVKQHVASGELRFDPQALAGCVAACQKMLDHMDDQLYLSHHLRDVDGFGHTIVGTDLAGKFRQQATAAADVINAHRVLLTDMIATFRQAASNYQATEGHNTGALGGTR